MDLVRVEAEERLINVEDALGRDTSSVFPIESKKQGFIDKEAAKEALGAVKFVTETELLEIKAQRGNRPEDGTMMVTKPLAEVLEENKAAKEEKFQEVWKSMKIGKNRALDVEELEFLDGVYDREREVEQAQRKEEEQELDAFRLAQLEAANAKSDEAGDATVAAVIPKPTQQQPKPKAKAQVLRPIIKAKKLPSVKESDEDARPAKRGKADSILDKGGGSGSGSGLAGLMDYGSDDSE